MAWGPSRRQSVWRPRDAMTKQTHSGSPPSSRTNLCDISRHGRSVRAKSHVGFWWRSLASCVGFCPTTASSSQSPRALRSTSAWSARSRSLDGFCPVAEVKTFDLPLDAGDHPRPRFEPRGKAAPGATPAPSSTSFRPLGCAKRASAAHQSGSVAGDGPTAHRSSHDAAFNFSTKTPQSR